MDPGAEHRSDRSEAMEPVGWGSRLFWTAWTLRDVAAIRRLPYCAPSRLAALQARRVRATIAHAYASVPFYRDAMDERGLRPTDFRSADDLARLPLVTGADLARAALRFRSRAFAHEPLLELTTSGTSGHAKRIWWDRAAVFRARASGVHLRDVQAELLGTKRRLRVLHVDRRGGTRDDVVAFHRRHSWFPGRLDSHGAFARPEERFERNLIRINAAAPDVISGFGAYIGAIYRWALENDRAIHVPKLVWYGGERLPGADAKLLESVFGIPVRTSYQACEALRIAAQCPQGTGLHIWSDQVAVRIADHAGRTLPPGRRGRIVLSNLTNRATVLLNYAIGDVGTLAAAACACGRTLPMLAALEGREDDLVRLPGGEVAHDSVLLSALHAVPGVIRLQLVQHALDRFTIRAVRGGMVDEPAFRARLVGALQTALGGRRVDTAVEIADELAPDASGKFRTVVSQIARGPGEACTGAPRRGSTA